MASTKLESLEAMRESGAKLAQQSAIRRFLRENECTAFSRAQLAQRLSMRVSSVCARIDELIREGEIVRDLPTRDEVTNRTVQTVRATPYMFPA